MRFKEEKGISIIEVMIAITILALALLPMMAMFETGISSTTVAGEITIATQLANDRIEEIRNHSFLDVYNTYKDEVVENYGTIPDFPRFRRVTVAEYVDENLDPVAGPTDLLRVTVTLYWHFRGSEKSHSEVTLIARR
ncbi:MAG: prepilin-type N-terminal cleavage/methylation domain-containing protein [Actinomycetota bacterium]|nr:prepilin-type N-terminal cleavage/methylation domain-containing protein [Actinomycetota bacterium]